MRWLLALLCCQTLADTAGLPATLSFAARPLPPYMEQTPSGYKGAHLEIMSALTRQIGVRLKLVECPSARCLRMLEVGDVDVAMGYARDPQRDAYLDFLQPSYASPTRTQFYVRHNETRSLQQAEDVSQFRAGLVRGVFYSRVLTLIPEANRDYGPDMETNFRKLAAGHVDMVPAGVNVGTRVIDKLALVGKVRAAPFSLVLDTERHISLSRRSAWHPHKARLEAAFATLVQKGEVSAILARHEEVDSTRKR
ncbi:ABC transporter substrate-binding protein [Chitinimonas sp. BJYL2]|uniref:substrate-binding periplasmic protein n=1 Tax=Chitinimonas sp. BJYL2 TaxID=2976696 RepID=UPI0022B2F30F|nr:transporter substrate-binding domain-containing protein [Chitinimonas sp. BJYL2]